MVLLERVSPVCMCSYAVCILIEDIPLCFNSQNKTNSLLSKKYYIIIGILLCRHVSIFLYTIFRPAFISKRYSHCLQCTVGSHIIIGCRRKQLRL